MTAQEKLQLNDATVATVSKQSVFTITFKSDATACNWVEENSSMILAQVISEACRRDWWFQVQRTVHSQQDGLWLIQIIVISYGISARMNSIQTLVILGIYYACFLVYLYLVFFFYRFHLIVLQVWAEPMGSLRHFQGSKLFL